MTQAPLKDPNEDFAKWIDEVSARRRFGLGDKKGTANLIDEAARRRAAEAIETGTCTALNRPVPTGPLHVDASSDGSGSHIELPRSPDGSGVRADVHHSEMAGAGSAPMQLGAGDTLLVEAHGMSFTHLDALNHMGRAGTWYGGFAADDPQAPSIADLANHLLFTRAVVADIPSVRGTQWVEASHPVTSDDIDAAMKASGTDFQPGDALLLYMGRDRFEAAGNDFGLSMLASGAEIPGAGEGVARWIVDHDVSILAWDFLDGFPRNQTEPEFQVHSLLWAIGLLLLDNCHLGPAAATARSTGRSSGALVVATPPIPGITGALVQPLFIQ